MANRKSDFTLPTFDDIFSTQEQRDDAKLSKIRDIPISEIDDFPDHPFKMRDDEDMLQLVESVKERGVITPATVRQKEDGRYELVSGHRRKRACELAGFDTLRCEVVNLSKEEATILMVESNFQRSQILPSEKAYHLLWNGDYYYVIGYSEKKGKIVTFRVDRIASTPEILEKGSVPQPEDFNIADFTKEVFYMYDGDEVTVDLRCDNSLMKTMVNRFGEDVTTLAYDMTSFRLITEVSASQTFFGWVFGFGGKVQILAPAEVKEQYRQMIQNEFDTINKEQE
ncbi:WYL domain-containing protein [Bianquea renquensis]|jgi:chromosome partitioning protein parB|nr:WYL domain-containing protein [Bianquea renquensis]